MRFGLFDRDDGISESERLLPHWFQPGVATFITFRTADSMPTAVLDRWQREQRDWLQRERLDLHAVQDRTRLQQLPPRMRRAFQRFREQSWQRNLDDCHGACVLRRPQLARIVGDSLRYFDGERYDLDCFVVMPNHVHLLVQFRPPTTLRKQCQSWLHYTAVTINRHLGQRGRFWQSEPFDHLIRSVEQFEYLRRYIADNPERANLRKGEYLHWASVALRSARWQQTKV